MREINSFSVTNMYHQHEGVHWESCNCLFLSHVRQKLKLFATFLQNWLEQKVRLVNYCVCQKHGKKKDNLSFFSMWPLRMLCVPRFDRKTSKWSTDGSNLKGKMIHCCGQTLFCLRNETKLMFIAYLVFKARLH